MGRCFWTDSELQILFQCYGKAPIARLCEVLSRSTKSIYNAAHTYGLMRRRTLAPSELVEMLRRRNSEGWLDSEIAAEWNSQKRSPSPAVNRRYVANLRLRLALPPNRDNARHRSQVAARTKLWLDKIGMPSLGAWRSETHRRFAEQRGWPRTLRPREVQIMDALYERGPATRQDLADRIGVAYRSMRLPLVAVSQRKLFSCKYGRGSYLANLMGLGLVVRSTRKIAAGKGRGKSRYLYSCAPWVRRGMNWENAR